MDGHATMIGNKRPRACDACHSIKIKCELGTVGGSGPCQRCTRLGKECIITPPKSQKDRVAELEAQVAALTRLLEAQNIGSQTLDTETRNELAIVEASDGVTPSNLPQKKRKMQEVTVFPDASLRPDLRELDAIVSKDLQKQLVKKYTDEVMPLTPLVPFPEDWDDGRLRDQKPILFQTIVYAVSSGVLPEVDQETLGSLVLKSFDNIGDRKCEKSLELIQAMQVAVLWYRAPKNHRQIASFQLAQRAAKIAENIGIWSVRNQSSLRFKCVDDFDDPAAALRAWLVCHLLCASISILVRQPSLANLGELDDFSLHMLGYENGLATDRVLCHFVQAERLCERIMTDLKMFDLSHWNDVSNSQVQVTMQALQRSVVDWKSQIPLGSSSVILGIYEHVAALYVHESVLHTGTNKHSFAAPYLAERLSATDFPTPIVTPDHVASIYALKSAAHALLDLFATFEIGIGLSVPFVLILSRVAYAQYILVKLYIATTGIGNTFGAFLDPQTLQVEKYLDQLIAFARLAEQIDSSCPAARLLLAPTRLKEWFLRHRTSNADNAFQRAAFDNDCAQATPVTSKSESIDWDSLTLDYNTLDWELESLFAQPPLQDVFSESIYDDDAPSFQATT